MKELKSILNIEEILNLKLRALYQNYGYSHFTMSKFEEYDLYVQNKDFLLSDIPITFMDTNGKLMALKPDVTLSIIQNSRDNVPELQKIYYSENVYRVSKINNLYKEIPQTGIECIGNIDLYNTSEVIKLACESLNVISPSNILDLSHMGILISLIDKLTLPPTEKKSIYTYVGEKNLHCIRTTCEAYNADMQICNTLIEVISLYGSVEKVIPKLKMLSISNEMNVSILELEKICNLLNLHGLNNIKLDFSLINGLSYYDGIVFQGFIEGIPSAVLAGGCYDKLMKKMGKNLKGIGFAIYIDLINYLSAKKIYSTFDVDTLLLYDKTEIPTNIINVVNRIIEQGQSIQVQQAIPDKLKYRTLLLLRDGRIEILESNN